MYVRALAALFLLCCITGVFSIGYKHFSGGTLSYVVATNNVTGNPEVHIDIITGWRLKQGPCGPNCSKSDVGKDTINERRTVEMTHSDPLYFGNWSTEAGSGPTLVSEYVNDEVKRNMKAHVMAISEIGKWEQEQMSTVIELHPINNKEDIVYEGYSWRDLQLQTTVSKAASVAKWHLQAKLNTAIRSDTGRPNASPNALMKPFYRIELNQVTQITIAAIDIDDDIVKCSIAFHIEGGVLSQHVLPGITVNKNCTVSINASSALNYTDDTWGGVALTVRDYNREDLFLGAVKKQANTFALGGATVQFLIQVLEHLDQPEFVSPTDPSNHRFYLYTGTNWNVAVYAKSSENTTIGEVLVLGRQNEVFTVSELKDDTSGRERVKYVTVSWRPAAHDTGNHIICVRAVDNTGVDTAEDRCFIIEVKDKVFHATNITMNKPYFMDLPSYNETVSCDIDSTCVFPIYVHSDDKIIDIKIDASFEYTKESEIVPVQRNGDTVYKMELSLMHNEDGEQSLCLIATDINGKMSERECLRSEIIAADPCISAPCQNSATCKRRVNDTADYECHCVDQRRFAGKNCAKKEYHDCEKTPSPCGPGDCIQRTEKVRCMCFRTGFTGAFCTINEDDCKPNSCNGGGICKDETKGFNCACYARYNGSHCEHDLCPSTPSGHLHCDGANVPGCNPNPCIHGQCIKGGNCVCPLAFKSDQNCTNALGDLNLHHTKLAIVPPTLIDKSDVVCYINKPCIIPLFIATPTTAHPNVEIDRLSDDLRQGLNITTPNAFTELPQLQNIFTSTVTITPNTTQGRGLICLIVSDSATKERRCFSLTVKKDPVTNRKSSEYKHKYAVVKFLDPTPKGDTRIIAYKDMQYHLLFYTNAASPGQCDEIVPTEDTVHVFTPTVTNDGECQTEITYTFTTLGTKRICFQSSPNATQAQLRCYDFAVLDTDPCSNSPCQNNAYCFLTDDGSSSYCECLPGYTGVHCEKGPCQTSENYCVKGYCHVDNHNVTCFCPIGYDDKNCGHSLASSVTDPDTNGAVFSDIARIRTITCIRNRPCSSSFISSGTFTYPDRPNVAAGYVHPSINILDLFTDTYSVESPGSYLTSLVIQGKKIGTKDMCLQILNKARVNKDEICIKVSVTAETSTIWTEKDKPHFVNPSLPHKTDITCIRGDPCHLVFYGTPGEKAGSTECVALQMTSDDEFLSHISSPCDNCTSVPNNKNCTFDVVMFPNQKTEMCISAITTVSNENGEKRCYNITVEQSIPPSGCQVLECLNEGFCDGHGDSPICHCTLPYTGKNCGIDASLNSSLNSKTFVGQMGILQMVKCYTGTPCNVPFSVGGSTPNVGLGYISPGLDINPPNITVNPSTKQQTGSVTVTPFSTGKHRYCLQLMNSSTVDDELCVTVVVEAGPEQPIEKSNPYFLPPTPPKDSLIVCEADKTCHLDLHFTPGNLFGSAQACPTITDTSADGGEDVYIHPSIKSSADCTSDVSYIPPTVLTGSDRILCFEVGLPSKRGEKRCFNIHVVASMLNELKRPCVSKTCDNGGKCIAEFPDDESSPVISSCICPTGFHGNDCSSVFATDGNLPGVTGVNPSTAPNYTSSHTPHFDLEAGLPVSIKCEVNKPCPVYIPFHGLENHPPLPGHVDSNLTIVDTSVLAKGNNSMVQVFKLSSNKTGTCRMCVQTTAGGDNQGVNIDEMCFDVETLPPGSLNQHPTQALANFPDNATVNCPKDSMCHLTVVSHNLNNCSEIKECGNGVPGLRIYTPPPPQPGVCVSDIAVRTDNLGSQQDLCLTTGSGSEEKHVTLSTATITEFGPCQKLHCQSGGHCDIIAGTATCVCMNSFTGTSCEIVVPTNGNLPGVTGVDASTIPNYTSIHTPHFDLDAGLPVSIKCEVNKPCPVYIPFHGLENHPPVPGHVDSNLTIVDTSVLAKGNNSMLQVFKLSSNKTGTSKMCVQTTAGGDKQGVNIDEMCFDVETLPPGSLNQSATQALANFPDNATVNCPKDSTCHLTVVSHNLNQCPEIKKCGNGVPGLRIYTPPPPQPGVCVSDIAVRTDNVDRQQDLCLTTGSGNEEKHVTLSTTTITEFGPCQKLHCQNGGHCDIIAGTATCVCMNSFTGTSCEIDVPTTINLPGVTGVDASTIPNYTSSHTPHFDLDAGLPVSIKCEVNKPCPVYIPFHGLENHPPVPGHVDSNLTIVDSSVLAKGNNSMVQVFKLSSNKTGTSRMCVQTTAGGDKQGVNIDEVCFDVETLPTGSLNQHATQALANFPDNATVNCPKDSTCHLTVVSHNLNHCPEIKECGNGVPGLRIYTPPPPQPGVCVSDIAVRTDNVDRQQDLCLTTGSGGEEKHITLSTTTITEFGPCQKLHCQNGGHCDNIVGTATCVCMNSFTGASCEIEPCTSPLPDVHLATHENRTVFPNGYKAKYLCNPGYEFSNVDGYTCVSANNSWIGPQPECMAKSLCANDSDCLNGGSCNSHTCTCTGRFKNSNCDTSVCSNPPQRRGHSRFVLHGVALFTDGHNATYKCDHGYEQSPNSSAVYTCNATTDIWQGQGIYCVAINNCQRDVDCLNGGTCDLPSTTCNCATGWGNTNCDTAVCDKSLSNVTHGAPVLTKVLFVDGLVVNYTCGDGYEHPAGSVRSVVCDATSNTWTGQPDNCTAIQSCSKDVDCLHSGSCDVPNHTCNCTVGWSNTNCDTAVCSTPFPTVAHASVVTPIADYIAGFNITYTCAAGYKPAPTSSSIYTCDITNNKWLGNGLTCVAKEHCVNDGDCLNAGKCITHRCNCTAGFANTNCDTAVCDVTPPIAIHAVPIHYNNTYVDGSQLNYKCEDGYTILPGVQSYSTCNAAVNTWVGTPVDCTAIQQCQIDVDCLNGGTCDLPSKRCNCTTGWGNTNCDTAVCDKNLPTVTHGAPVQTNALSVDGFVINYTCAAGYELRAGSVKRVVCDATSNTWTGQPENCTAIRQCTKDGDCIHNGRCDRIKQTCNCTERWGNTNCDTAVCSDTIPTVQHASVVTPIADYIAGFNITYTCDAGYEPAPTSSRIYTCDVTNNKWLGNGLTCIAKVHCSSDADCLNEGTCSHTTCACAVGFSNTNCDTGPCKHNPGLVTHGRFNLTRNYTRGESVELECDDGYELADPSHPNVTCDSTTQTWTGDPTCIKTPLPRESCDTKTSAARARDVVKKGQTSCYCNITIPGSTNTKKLQVIKRRPVITMGQILTAAGMGAGGMAGGMAVAIGIYILVQKVKKGQSGKRPLPSPSPRTGRVGPVK